MKWDRISVHDPVVEELVRVNCSGRTSQIVFPDTSTVYTAYRSNCGDAVVLSHIYRKQEGHKTFYTFVWLGTVWKMLSRHSRLKNAKREAEAVLEGSVSELLSR